ncbi:hypothetical protein ADK75_16965 [Streptomyces virginiae]|uniref:Uncharacterized protein n=1 Tax=Streptomyces virginiae TaxID=1961 RepID=A0A0L8MM16_STRVG|nr:hypothetical protein ADK75_16965 [Streptomyces virginiae]
MSLSFRVRTCEPSIAASFMSSGPVVRSSVRRMSCRRGRAPASVQFRRRRQHVTPLRPIVSVGTCARLMPVRRT